MENKYLKFYINQAGRKIKTDGLTLNQNSSNNVMQLITIGKYDSVEVYFRNPHGEVSPKYHMILKGEYEKTLDDSTIVELAENTLYLWEFPIPYGVTSFTMTGTNARLEASFSAYVYTKTQRLNVAAVANTQISVSPSNSSDSLDEGYNGTDVENLWKTVGDVIYTLDEYDTRLDDLEAQGIDKDYVDDAIAEEAAARTAADSSLQNQITLKQNILTPNSTITLENNEIGVNTEVITTKQYVDGLNTTLSTNIANSGHTLNLVQNTQTYDYVIQLKNANNEVISSIDIDLPLEQIITDGYYDETENAIILVLDNGSKVTIPVGDMVDDLVSQEALTTKLHDYVKDVEITSIKTVNEVLTEIGGVNHIFSFDLMGIKYIGLFVENQSSGYDLELWHDGGTSKVTNISTSQLFRTEIGNAVEDKVYIPVVSLSNPTTNLSQDQLHILSQDNSVIVYGGRIYNKANETASGMEFVSADVDDSVADGYHTQSKYEVLVDKTNSSTSVVTANIYYYDKDQAEGKFAALAGNNTFTGSNGFQDVTATSLTIGTTNDLTVYDSHVVTDKKLVGGVPATVNFALPTKSSGNYTFATEDYVTTTVGSAISSLRDNSYQKVNLTTYPTIDDFLASTGEVGYIYLYPNNTADLSEGYHQFIWEDNAWLDIGSTALDLSGYVDLESAQTITGLKTFTGGMVTNHLRPSATGTIDLGSGTYKWKDVYVAGSLKDGSNSITLASIAEAQSLANTALQPTDVGGLVTLGTEQDITATKNITGVPLYFTQNTNSGGGYIKNNGSSAGLVFGEALRTTSSGGQVSYNEIMLFGMDISDFVEDTPGSGSGASHPSFHGITGGTPSLGNSNYPWGRLYLSGDLTDGTNSVTVANIASKTEVAAKQDQLTAGTGISISNGVISADITGISYSIVQALPATGEAGVIYLVASSASETNNTYDEYIYVNNAFEKIGSTAVDLSDYALKSELPTVNNATLTINRNGTQVAQFTANSASNVTANIQVPTTTSDLTNDSGFITNTSASTVTLREW